MCVITRASWKTNAWNEKEVADPALSQGSAASYSDLYKIYYGEGILSMKIIMLGAPGAGKGTQAQMIADKFNIPHISTGDIFRANIKNGTELGKKAKEFMDKGLLVPDELTVQLLLDRVANDDCKNGYVLDGFPRTIPQADVLDAELTKLGDKVDFAVNVDVPDENIVRRMSGRRACLKCGATYHIEHIPPKKEGICDKCGAELTARADDNEETIKSRLETYFEQTSPLVNYYEEKGKLFSATVSKTINKMGVDVANDVLKKLEGE